MTKCIKFDYKANALVRVGHAFTNIFFNKCKLSKDFDKNTCRHDKFQISFVTAFDYFKSH